MRIIERQFSAAFDRFEVTGDVYELAIDMFDLGRKCLQKDRFNFILEKIFEIEGEHPRHIPFKQSTRYLMMKGKKKREENRQRGKKKK